MTNCYYCNKPSSQMVPLGKHWEALDDEGNPLPVQFNFICAPGTGCQSKYKPSWADLRASALLFEGSSLILSLILILFTRMVFSDLDFKYLNPQDPELIQTLRGGQMALFTLWIIFPEVLIFLGWRWIPITPLLLFFFFDYLLK